MTGWDRTLAKFKTQLEESGVDPASPTPHCLMLACPCDKMGLMPDWNRGRREAAARRVVMAGSLPLFPERCFVCANSSWYCMDHPPAGSPYWVHSNPTQVPGVWIGRARRGRPRRLGASCPADR